MKRQLLSCFLHFLLLFTVSEKYEDGYAQVWF